MKTKIKTKMLAYPAVATLLCSGSASAQTNLLVNGSFEDNDANLNIPTSIGTLYDLTGWSGEAYGGGSGVSPIRFVGGWSWTDPIGLDGSDLEADGLATSSNPTLNGIIADGKHGDQYAMVANFANDPSALSQAVSTVFGQQYSFSGVLGMLHNPTSGDSIAGVYVNGLLAASVGESDWDIFNYNYTATSTTSLIEVKFAQHNAGGSQVIVADNFKLIAVPEPSSTTLLGIATLGLMTRRKR